MSVSVAPGETVFTVDSPGSQLMSSDNGELLDRSLARRVQADTRFMEHGIDRGDVDDATVIPDPSSSLAQRDERTLRFVAITRSKSSSVVSARSPTPIAALLTNNVQSTAMRPCGIEVFPDVAALGLVGLQRPGFAAGCPDGLDYLSGGLIVSEIAERDRRSVSGEPLDDGSTDTA